MIKSVKTRRGFLKNIGIAASAILLLNLFFSCGNGSMAGNEPNIILILTDDQGWTDTSVQMMANRTDSKSDFYQTPNLERLAKEGMIFSNAYASAPVCSPTRHSILYGKTPTRLRHATLNKTAAITDGLSIPQMIKATNPQYITAHFGKWHQPTSSPETAGYDQSDGPTGNGEGDWISPGVHNPSDDPKKTFSISQRACDFMTEQKQAGRPFFMQVSYYAVHVQNYALDKTKGKYRKMTPGKKSTPRDFELPAPPLNQGIVTYAAMVEDLDTGFGTILDKLEELAISENTYVIFTSDNGGGFRKNKPLKKGKADLFEGGLRVPTVVRGPKVMKSKYCDVPIVGWDFMPTISDLIGNKDRLPEEFDGGSLRSLFENGNEGSVKRGEEALIFHFPWFNGEPESAIRLGDYKLIKNIDSQKLWLFNLAEDIEEENNLVEAMPEKAEELHKRLKDYLDSVGAEHVQSLRTERRRIIVEQNIPDTEKRIKELKSRSNSLNESERKQLAKSERYLKWLKEQVVFIDERSKLHK